MNTNISISIDLKKYRLRIHKSSLHLLGDPAYIQLLVNPDKKLVAFRSLDRESPHAQSHRISMTQLKSDGSIEIYSYPFLSKLRDLTDAVDEGKLYRMHGMAFPSSRVAVFPLSSLSQVTDEENAPCS